MTVNQGATPYIERNFVEVRMDYNLTAVYRRVREGYVGFVEELPGANTQGATLDEARANCERRWELVIEANRSLFCQENLSCAGESKSRDRDND
jgi:predicted RNase H-like HicB family nuclease